MDPLILGALAAATVRPCAPLSTRTKGAGALAGAAPARPPALSRRSRVSGQSRSHMER